MWSNVLSSCNYQHSQDAELFHHQKGTSLCFPFILSLPPATWERMGEFKVEEWKDLRQVNWIKNVAYPTLGALEALEKVSDP